ncbi:unnamed protein product [Candidula unifasciata]|uniref:VPS9 domain-containing protein n=1 Tax=Candidula unifasciata TaxID=100452 RepID=A0A8S3YL22_9EUPU|nr:unnamed protein product [Candidula unifasciata]
MKVLIKLNGRTETVENVSVDDKCLPIVAGLHPYTSSSVQTSPLVQESVLWFKTLAVDAVYIDCDRRLVFWTPTVREAGTTDVVLRRSGTAVSDTANLIPAAAKPLFKDRSIYDLDASLKEMMDKCSEAVRKYFKKTHSAEEFHKILAQILHMYILPRLIEMRLAKSENVITKKAFTIENLKKCLQTLKQNLLDRENLDSERYLQTCKREFLITLLKTVESDIDDLNIELAAEQSKINWARNHPTDNVNLTEVKKRRDSLFHEVSTFIRVREAIKNVISRRNLTKRKVKKTEVINSCFHNIFVEIVRRLEMENRILGQLGNDKVNICATREALVCTLLEMVTNNRNSDRATKFEPEDFADFSVSEGQRGKKSGLWLTFQERVARVLENNSSVAFTLHKDGCRNIISKINLALSEFQLVKRDGFRLPHHRETTNDDRKNSRFYVSLNDVTLTDSEDTPSKSKRREAVLIDRNNEYVLIPNPFQSSGINKTQTLQGLKSESETGNKSGFLKRRVQSTININVSEKTNQGISASDGFNSSLLEPTVRKYSSGSSLTDMPDNENLSLVDEESDRVGTNTIRGDDDTLQSPRHVMTEQLALGSLMKTVENLKVQIQSHFKEVIKQLDRELRTVDLNEVSGQEHKELLWKSYERFFCEEVCTRLMDLYITGLTFGVHKAYATLRKTSLQEIMEDDKLLDLFFGGKEVHGRSVSIPVPSLNYSEDKVSLAKTLSSLSLDVRCCDVKELYTLANADGDDLCRRFNLDNIEYDDEDVKTSSSGSLRSAELSDDEGTYDSPSTSTQSATSVVSVDEQRYNTDKLKILSSPENITEIMEPVMSPFRKFITKCFNASCFLDKLRYITKAIENLNSDISQMISPDFKSACDDIISMLVLALYSLPEEMFINLYINLRLLMDVLPDFLSGTLWEYNLVTLCASYDYLFTREVCQRVIRQYPGSF